MKYFLILFVIFNLLTSTKLYADTDIITITYDNDIFIGNDSGYTNGIFISTYDLEDQNNKPSPTLLVKPLTWSLFDKNYGFTVNAYTFGQIMMTPHDIELDTPPENDLPYTGLLFVNTTFLNIHESYADKIGTTLGVVGPLSGAEEVQKWVHKLIGSDEPRGWDTETKNELVFQFSRGRVWRSWHSDHMDMLTGAEINLGTLSSAVKAGAMLRYGSGLAKSFATPLLSSSKTTNPVAVTGGWYVYAGIDMGYTFNQIFTDGNTFQESRSIDYDHKSLGLTAGFAYSWENVFFSLTINDANAITQTDERLKDLTQYGSLTLGWRN